MLLSFIVILFCFRTIFTSYRPINFTDLSINFTDYSFRPNVDVTTNWTAMSDKLASAGWLRKI